MELTKIEILLSLRNHTDVSLYLRTIAREGACGRIPERIVSSIWMKSTKREGRRSHLSKKREGRTGGTQYVSSKQFIYWFELISKSHKLSLTSFSLQINAQAKTETRSIMSCRRTVLWEVLSYSEPMRRPTIYHLHSQMLDTVG